MPHNVLKNQIDPQMPLRRYYAEDMDTCGLQSVSLACLVPDGGAGINLVMQILFGDFGQKLLKGRLRFRQGSYYQFAVCQRQFDRCLHFESSFGGEGLGDSQSKTVAPFLNTRSHVRPLYSGIYIEDTN